MRYTARARMLSFDFLCDDVVYELPPTQALLLAGMVTRADNLGRLPGNSSVLLSYLFWPKQPRPDMTDRDVEDLLMVLASVKPPVIRWYQRRGDRFVEFSRWLAHQGGIRERNRKSILPAPDDEGCVPVLEVGGQMALAAEPEAAIPGYDVRALIRTVAGQHSMARTLRDFEESRVWAWVRGSEDRQGPGLGIRDAEWVRLAHWLWNTGTHDMDDVLGLLAECERQAPRNAYAYLAPEVRTPMVTKMRGDRAAAENERFKREDRAFLSNEATK